MRARRALAQQLCLLLPWGGVLVHGVQESWRHSELAASLQQDADDIVREAASAGLFSETGAVGGVELDSSAGLIAHVNPFIGTSNHGHTFPGATTPWGMVQVTPWGHGTNAWDTG